MNVTLMKKNSRGLFIVILCMFFIMLSWKPLPAAEETSGSPYLKALKWRSIGPHRGGRVVAVTGHPVKKNVFYFGGTGSGVWKTENAGETWENISDGFFKTSSVGAITVSRSNPNIIYVGMGECCLRGNISHGDGVYKSTDGGKTWKQTGLENTRHIARISVHPQNSDIVYVAALGHAFGPNKERGLFRSTDGGKTWKNILFRSDKSGAIDLVMHPGNPDVLYTAFWEVQRFPWGFVSGGPGSAVYKSTDGGNTWKDISENPGLPKGIKGRTGLTVSAADSDRVWAIVEAKKSGVYRSDDGGEKWQLVSSDANLLQRPWYYHHIKADPVNPDTVYVMNVGFWKSTDGGKTFKRLRVPHGDNHDLWIDPADPMRMIEGNDGGATVTFDGGQNWSSVLNQPTAQFYHVTTDNRFPYRVYGAQQDNSTISVPSRSAMGAIIQDQWYEVGGCESGYIAVHPENPDIVYAGCFGGTLSRYDHKLERLQDISVWPENPMGWGAADLKYRFQWTFPIFFSPHDANVLYVAGNHVFRSTTEGREWEAISPDLTRNDKSKMEPSGGPLTRDNTSVEYYGTIFALAESTIQKGLMWAGSDDGLIHLSRDGGKNWEDITPNKKIMPQWSLISIIEPSHFHAGAAYVAATRYKLDDNRPYLFVTKDFGKTWKKITNGIPIDDFTRVIREDPNHENILYAGTETAVYFSADSGKNWQSLQYNLPKTPIHDMVVHENDLVLATHGRSFWILDDLTLLYQALEARVGEAVFLFKPRKTVRFPGWHNEAAVNAGETLPAGAIINYYLKEKPAEDEPVTLSILDSQGELVRTFSRKPEKKKEPPVPVLEGINRFIWNLRYPPSRSVEGAVFWGPGKVEPTAVPGTYTVRLTVGKKELEKSFEVTGDPNIKVTREEYKQLFDFQVKIRETLSRVHDAVNEIRGIRKQIQWYKDRTEKEPYFEKIEKAAAAVDEKLKPIEDALIQHKAKAQQDLLNYPIRLNNKLAALGAWVVESIDGAPTKQSLAVFAELSSRADEQINRLTGVIKTEVAAFNKLIRDLQVPAVMLKHHASGGQGGFFEKPPPWTP
jgi:photosystem II stability/assembly factor-like uncharacterized protein